MITISHMALEPAAPVLENDLVKQLYVAYTFLDIEPQELETPFSLPKPKAYQQIAFNFSKSKHKSVGRPFLNILFVIFAKLFFFS